MEKKRFITLIKDSFNEISIYIGINTLKIVLERIFSEIYLGKNLKRSY